MKHLGTQQLETERLILRRFTAADAAAMYANWAGDDEVTRFLTWPTHPNAEVSGMVISQWLASYEKPSFYQWAIVYKPDGTGEPIGTISVVNAIDDVIRSAEIGYCIGRPWWRRGVMTEALQAVMAFLFDEVGVNRVEAAHDVNNPHSGCVMRKCGMTPEGIHRQAARNNQGVVDVSIYALLSGER